ncbi:hypothetical protein [Clostridium butyricum]|uniref:hypothetical protein n=1 Tax=Clostridium butyricum TaxID=1492 RepID=UPI001400EA93|nr:hypothetical protein [Clostridium butyricum]NFO41936.1 hypothetical protein [Clostridium botulinum]
MQLYVNEKEYEELKKLENEIDNAKSYICDIEIKSMIIGHDLKAEVREIERYLKIAFQRTQKLKNTYEEVLKNNIKNK